MCTEIYPDKAEALNVSVVSGFFYTISICKKFMDFRYKKAMIIT